MTEFTEQLIDQIFMFIAMEGLNGAHYECVVNPACKWTRYTSPNAMLTIYPGPVHSVGLSVGSTTVWVPMESDDTERLQGLMEKLSTRADQQCKRRIYENESNQD